MIKRIAAIFALILIAITITQTAFALGDAVYGSNWSNPYHYSNYYYIPPQYGDAMPFNPDSVYNMSPEEVFRRTLAANFLALVLVPIFVEIIIALVTGVMKIKPIVISAIVFNIVMQGLITAWVYLANGNPAVLFLILHVLVCFVKFKIYKIAFEYRYTTEKLRSYVITIGIVELIYFLLIF